MTDDTKERVLEELETKLIEIKENLKVLLPGDDKVFARLEAKMHRRYSRGRFAKQGTSRIPKLWWQLFDIKRIIYEIENYDYDPKKWKSRRRKPVILPVNAIRVLDRLKNQRYNQLQYFEETGYFEPHSNHAAVIECWRDLFKKERRLKNPIPKEIYMPQMFRELFELEILIKAIRTGTDPIIAKLTM